MTTTDCSVRVLRQPTASRTGYAVTKRSSSNPKNNHASALDGFAQHYVPYDLCSNFPFKFPDIEM